MGLRSVERRGDGPRAKERDGDGGGLDIALPLSVAPSGRFAVRSHEVGVPAAEVLQVLLGEGARRGEALVEVRVGVLTLDGQALVHRIEVDRVFRAGHQTLLRHHTRQTLGLDDAQDLP